MPIFSHNLLPYGGPYKVGTLDLELPTKVESFGTALLAGTQTPALLLETTLVTIYYPSSPLSKGTGRKHAWAEPPITRTLEGYARFSEQSKWLLLPPFWLIVGGKKIPAYVEATLAEKESEMEEQGSSSDPSEKGEFPVIVFSHGLGGTRTTYSQYCGELASRGNVIVAVEHRDGSGPSTLVSLENGLSRKILYLRPSDVHFPPPSPTLSQIGFRKEQLLMRVAEIREVLSVLKRINDGEGDAVALENRRGKGKDRVQGLGLWKGRLDLQTNVTMGGHSFGGATTLQVLRAGAEFPFRSGITLDPWVDAIPPIPRDYSSGSTSGTESPQKAGTDIDVPLLVINSEAFTVWTSHFNVVRDIIRAVAADAWLLTLVGSVHLSFSDLPLFSRLFAKGARIPATSAVADFVKVSLEFLSGNGRDGEVLGGKVQPGDEDGTRLGEGEGKPMSPDGELRLHFVPWRAAQE